MGKWLMMAAALFAAVCVRASGSEIAKPEAGRAGEISGPVNLYDPAGSQRGFYVNWQTGRPLENPDYDLSGFIAVKPNTWYAADCNRMLAFYDRNRGYIYGLENGPAPFRFKTPPNAAYLRISVRKSWSEGFTLLEEGPEPGALVNLPKTIYASDKSALNIYNAALIDTDRPEEYAFRWSCPVGRGVELGFVADAGNAPGEYPLRVEISDASGKKTDEASVVLKILGATGDRRNLKLLAVGDSPAAVRPWLAELRSLADVNCGRGRLELVGRRGADGLHYEGRRGYSSGSYSSRGESGCEFKVVAPMTLPPIGTRYAALGKNGVRLVFELMDGSSGPDGASLYMKRLAGSGDAVEKGELKAVIGGTEPAVIAYDAAVCAEGNPFWNPERGAVDFKYYEQNAGIRPDAVLFLLGTVDYDDDAYHDNMKKLIDACNRDWNVPILLALPPFPGPRVALDRQAGGRVFAAEAHRVMYRQHRRTLDELAGLPNVVIVPLSACFDSVNGYDCFNGGQDAVRPMPEGCRQFAAVIFSTLLSVW